MTKHHIGEWPGTATYLQRSTRLALGMTYHRTEQYEPRHGRERDCLACLDTGLMTSRDPHDNARVVVVNCPHGCPVIYTTTERAS